MNIRAGKIQNFMYSISGSVSLLTFMVYLSSLQNDFVGYDDRTYVVGNPFIRSLSPAFFEWAFSDFYAANWHPLTWISHALDYAVWGLNPLGHHLTNNILHAVNTFLVVVLVVRLLEAADSRFTLIAAATTGLLFGLHPIHVESVAWVAERKDLLCGLFFLLSILTYMRYARNTFLSFPLVGNPSEIVVNAGKDPGQAGMTVPGTGFLNKHYLLSLTFFLLALLSKPMAVSLPAVLLLLDWYPFNRITTMRTFGTAFIEKLPFLVLSLVSSILTVLAQKAGAALVAVEVIPLSTRMLVAAKSLIVYLWKMILPINLVPFYPYPEDVSFLSLDYFPIVFLVVVVTMVCVVTTKKHKLLLPVWGYYVLTLVPVLGIVQVGGQSMADRYTYLPSLSPFLVAGLMAAGLYEKVKTSIRRVALLTIGSIVTAFVVLAFMSYATLLQIGIWHDAITLWSYVIEQEPLKVPRAYINGGLALVDKGRMDEAIEYLQIAIRLDPSNANAHDNLGIAYKSKGRYDQAIGQFLAALDLRPDDPETHNNLGVAYRYKRMYDAAIDEHMTALRLKPDYAEAHFNLGILYLDRGAVDKARQELEAGLKMKPDDQKARQVLNEIISR